MSSPSFLIDNNIIDADSIKVEYKLLDKLGQGASGSVHKAIRIETVDESPSKWKSKDLDMAYLNVNNIIVIAKAIDIENYRRAVGKDREEAISLIMTEVQALQALSSMPNCNNYVSCYIDHFISNWHDRSTFFLIQEYIEGPTLSTYILNNFSNINYDIDNLWNAFTQLTEALSYIHKNGFAHRDIKGDNIIYDINRHIFRFVDFGLSCSINIKCRPGVGTISYMAPEIYGDDPNILRTLTLAQASDIWAMGIVFFELSHNTKPYTGYIFLPSTIDNRIKTDYNGKKSVKYLPSTVNYIIDWMLNTNWLERPTSEMILQYLYNDTNGCAFSDNQFISSDKIFFRPHIVKELDDLYDSTPPSFEYIKKGRFTRKSYFKPAKDYNPNDYLNSLYSIYLSKTFPHGIPNNSNISPTII